MIENQSGINGMIFAAGLGTRLSPLTDSKPKALVEVAGKPLLWHAINHFYSYGVRYIVVNVHHFANQVIDFLAEIDFDGLEIVVSNESSQLLDTGGGLAYAQKLFKPDMPVLVGNADVFSNAPLDKMIDAHRKNKSDVTLMTMQRSSARQLVFNSEGLLAGWINHESGKRIVARDCANTHEAAFCGFHIIEPAFLDRLQPNRVFPIMDAYLDNAATCAISEFVMPPGYYWFDVGTVQKLETVERFVGNDNR